VDKSVAVNSLATDDQWSSYYYLSAYNPNSGYGILKKFIGRSALEIAKDVRSFIVVKDGETVVLENYSFAGKTGDLALYDVKGERMELDTNVNTIVPVRKERDRYSYVRKLAFFNEKFYFDIPQAVELEDA
jgi:hypothetical protein